MSHGNSNLNKQRSVGGCSPCLMVDIDIVGMAIRVHRTVPFGLSLVVIEEGEEIVITFPRLEP